MISPFLGNKILVLDMVSFRANGCFWNPQFKKDTLEFINKPLRFVSLTLFVSSFFPDLGWDMGGWVLFWGGGGWYSGRGRRQESSLSRFVILFFQEVRCVLSLEDHGVLLFGGGGGCAWLVLWKGEKNKKVLLCSICAAKFTRPF